MSDTEQTPDQDAQPETGAKLTRAEIQQKATAAAAAKRAAERAEREANAPQFVELINIRHPNERVLITEVTGKTRRGREIRTWTGEVAQFVETRYLAYDDDVLESVLASCPYVFIEPTEGKMHRHTKTGFQCRNDEAFDAWLNSDNWAKE